MIGNLKCKNLSFKLIGQVVLQIGTNDSSMNSSVILVFIYSYNIYSFDCNLVMCLSFFFFSWFSI